MTETMLVLEVRAVVHLILEELLDQEIKEDILL
jgi:hypothetical protein